MPNAGANPTPDVVVLLAEEIFQRRAHWSMNDKAHVGILPHASGQASCGSKRTSWPTFSACHPGSSSSVLALWASKPIHDHNPREARMLAPAIVRLLRSPFQHLLAHQFAVSQSLPYFIVDRADSPPVK